MVFQRVREGPTIRPPALSQNIREAGLILHLILFEPPTSRARAAHRPRAVPRRVPCYIVPILQLTHYGFSARARRANDPTTRIVPKYSGSGVDPSFYPFRAPDVPSSCRAPCRAACRATQCPFCSSSTMVFSARARRADNPTTRVVSKYSGSGVDPSFSPVSRVGAPGWQP